MATRAKVITGDDDAVEVPTETVTSSVVKNGGGNGVEVRLAHPISREADMRYFGIPVEDEYPAGTVLRLPKSAVESLIGAGYAAGVDPNEPEQVAAALNGPETEGEPTSEPGPATEGPIPAQTAASTPVETSTTS